MCEYLKKYLSEKGKINRLLRIPLISHKEDILKFKDELDKELRVGISYNRSFVYRIDHPYGDLDFNIFAQWFKHKLGKIIEFPCFLSTTYSPEVQFKNQPILYKIKTSFKSRGILTDSLFPRKIEAEVLFSCNSKFRITDINYRNEFIDLEEVDVNIKSDYIVWEDFYLEDPSIKEWYEKNSSSNQNSFLDEI